MGQGKRRGRPDKSRGHKPSRAWNKCSIAQLSDDRPRSERVKIGKLEVTDHAIVAYMERVLEVDLKEFVASMVTKTAYNAMLEVGFDGRFPIAKGATGVVTNGVLVTVVKKCKHKVDK